MPSRSYTQDLAGHAWAAKMHPAHATKATQVCKNGIQGKEPVMKLKHTENMHAADASVKNGATTAMFASTLSCTPRSTADS